jgi:hypothetical protein
MKKNYLSLLLFLYLLPGELLADCVSSISFDTDVAGSWEPSCTSEHRSGKYAKYYTFTLSSRQTVTIDLQSSTDPFLLLLNGSDQTGTPIAGNNDRDETTNDSQIIHTISAGTYTIEATTLQSERTGDFVVSVSASKASCSDCPFQINAGLNGSWYYPGTDGQGFLIDVFPDSKVMFVAWFTFDTEHPDDSVTANLGDPSQRWLTAQGIYADNQAVLDVYVSGGGLFDLYPPVPTREKDGTLTIEFSGCNAGTITYDIPSIGRQDVIPIERIVTENVPLCESLNEMMQAAQQQ